MTKKGLLLVIILFSLIFVLSSCSKQNGNSSSKPIGSMEQFKIVGQTAKENFKDVEEIYGSNSSYELGGVPFGSKQKNEYELMLKLEQVSPMTQQSFDNIRVKIQSYTNKILNKMSAVGIKHPILNLKIVDKNAVPFKGSEHLTTTFSLTK